ncbi:MAG: hypothetical protein AAFY44_12245, partial [Pseudomonadota bacterium]
SLDSGVYEVTSLALINSAEAKDYRHTELSRLEPIAIASAQFSSVRSQIGIMGRMLDVGVDATAYLGRDVIVMGIVNADRAIPVLVGAFNSPLQNGAAFVKGPIERIDPVYGRLTVGGFSVGYGDLFDGVFAPASGDYIEVYGVAHAAGMSATR